MNISEALDIIKEKEIPSHLFAVNSLGGGDCICIFLNYKEGEGWSTFYSEKGARSDIHLFSNENDACLDFIKRVILIEIDYKEVVKQSNSLEQQLGDKRFDRDYILKHMK